jgi:hypothetical protein
LNRRSSQNPFCNAERRSSAIRLCLFAEVGRVAGTAFRFLFCRSGRTWTAWSEPSSFENTSDSEGWRTNFMCSPTRLTNGSSKSNGSCPTAIRIPKTFSHREPTNSYNVCPGPRCLGSAPPWRLAGSRWLSFPLRSHRVFCWLLPYRSRVHGYFWQNGGALMAGNAWLNMMV